MKRSKLSAKQQEAKQNRKALKAAKAKLLKQWEADNLSKKAVCAYAQSNEQLLIPFLDAINKKHSTKLGVRSFSPSMFKGFGMTWEVENKTKFSMNFALTLIERKAKFGSPKSEKFVEYTAKRIEARELAQYRAKVKAEINAAAIAKGLNEVESNERNAAILADMRKALNEAVTA
jgi:hypothetical protein